MKIAKKKFRIKTPLVIPIIDLERLLEKVLRKGEYIAIKFHDTPGDNDSGSYEINLPCYGGGSSEESLVWKDKLLKALDGQSISTGPQCGLLLNDFQEVMRKLPLTRLPWILVYVLLIISTKYFWK